MERTPEGTPVGVDDPYAVAGVCDHLTDDGRCRFALTRAGDDRPFAAERRADGYACHVGADDAWKRCPHYRSTTDGRCCVRCGLEEVRVAHTAARPLIEEHHLSYSDGTGSAGDTSTSSTADVEASTTADTGTSSAAAGSHEITVALCRWCHAKVHNSVARIDDDASPDPEAIAEREMRRGNEEAEAAFRTAKDRYDGDDTDESENTDESG